MTRFGFRLSAAVAATVVVAIGVSGLWALANFNKVAPEAALIIDYFWVMGSPAGTLVTEDSPAFKPLLPAGARGLQQADSLTDWPSYNRTLSSDRFSGLTDINRANVSKLQVLCTYDTHQYAGFNTAILEIDNALIFTTPYDTFSINAETCEQNWRVHEDYLPSSPQVVNRGAAYLDGRVFRGTEDGRVLAYDFKTGRRLWETSIADPAKHESVPAAPIAWDGMVFVGNAGGDFKGNKGRMYGLDAATGKIKWEFFMVPKGPNDVSRGPEAPSTLDGASWQNEAGAPISGGATWTSYTLDPKSGLLYIPGGNPAPDFDDSVRPGANLYSDSVVILDAKTGAYKYHYKVVRKDWHDWDVSNPPVLSTTADGKRLMSVAPKDGYLYGFDLDTKQQIYKTPVTKILNADAPFRPDRTVSFCPGTIGGAEWNGPAYDPQTNLVAIGEVEWCASVTVQSRKQILGAKMSWPWLGNATWNPYHFMGNLTSTKEWAGWVYAVDADSGDWKWRIRVNYPIESGMTPTAGGVIFFGDLGGNFYAVDADNGQKLWGRDMGGALGGGVITYRSPVGQRVAVATGLTEFQWPTPLATAKISVLGLK